MSDQKIYIAGHQGMVGSAIVRKLIRQGVNPENILSRSHDQLDLTNQYDVTEFFANEKPDEVYLAAAKVGGIHANNTYPADFIYTNLMIEANVIDAAFRNNVKKLLFLGSSCIYPKLTAQPMAENALLTGRLEPTNEPYAIAKIAGIKLCESYNRQYGKTHCIDYRSLMPTNLYGTGDNYHTENSHVIPALIRRFHEAKINSEPSVVVWGTGAPKREFLHVDDLATACVFLMNTEKSIYENNVNSMQSHINIGRGEDVAICELAETISQVVGYTGTIEFDTSKPDGTPRKLLDSSCIHNLGWRATINLTDGLTATYDDFLRNHT